MTKSELESRTLCVMVWHFDRFGRNDFLGEVNVGFDHHSFDDPTPKWHKLLDRVSAVVSLPDQMTTGKTAQSRNFRLVSVSYWLLQMRGKSYHVSNDR